MSSGESFLLDPTFWVAGSFTVFVGGVIWSGAHKKIAAMLDERTASIKTQINEAKSLKEETEKLLADYRARQRDAEKEAADILAQAQEDAKIMAKEAKADIKALIERRTRAAEEKITQAEAAAVKQVKAAAVDVAIAAATEVLADAMKGKAGGELVDKAVNSVEGRLH